MPRLRVLSDLHLESVSFPCAFSMPDRDFEVLAVAGDVWRSRPRAAAETVARLAGGKPSVLVLGNHEPWGLHIDEARAEAAMACSKLGVTLLDDGAATVAGVRFVGGTLWTDGHLGRFVDDWPDGRTGEGVLVGTGRRLWTIRDAATAHAKTLAAIEAEMARPGGGAPLVVVTHHAPLAECLHPRTVGKPVSGITAPDLSRVVDTGRAALWIHGHVHHSVDLVRPGGTRVLSNPAGRAFDNPSFDEGLTVAVSSAEG